MLMMDNDTHISGLTQLFFETSLEKICYREYFVGVGSRFEVIQGMAHKLADDGLGYPTCQNTPLCL